MFEFKFGNGYVTDNGIVIPVISVCRVIEDAGTHRAFLLLKDGRLITCLLDDVVDVDENSFEEYGYAFDIVKVPHQIECGDEFRSKVIIDVVDNKLIKKEIEDGD